MRDVKLRAYRCFKVPEKPGFELLTKWRIPHAISRSGWKPLSDTAFWVRESSIFVTDLLDWAVAVVLNEGGGDIF